MDPHQFSFYHAKITLRGTTQVNLKILESIAQNLKYNKMNGIKVEWDLLRKGNSNFIFYLKVCCKIIFRSIKMVEIENFLVDNKSFWEIINNASNLDKIHFSDWCVDFNDWSFSKDIDFKIKILSLSSSELYCSIREWNLLPDRQSSISNFKMKIKKITQTAAFW